MSQAREGHLGMSSIAPPAAQCGHLFRAIPAIPMIFAETRNLRGGGGVEAVDEHSTLARSHCVNFTTPPLRRGFFSGPSPTRHICAASDTEAPKIGSG